MTKRADCIISTAGIMTRRMEFITLISIVGNGWQNITIFIILCSISVHMCVHTEPNLLRAVFALKFTNNNMYDAFTNTHLSGNWIFFYSSYTAVLIF